MILVDSSVLIDYFKGDENLGVRKLEYVRSHKIVYGINGLIFHELLKGCQKNEFELLEKYLSSLPFYELRGKASYAEAAGTFRLCRKEGFTVHSIDLLIAQTAIENDLQLLHNDSDYHQIQKVLPQLSFY